MDKVRVELRTIVCMVGNPQWSFNVKIEAFQCVGIVQEIIVISITAMICLVLCASGHEGCQLCNACLLTLSTLLAEAMHLLIKEVLCLVRIDGTVARFTVLSNLSIVWPCPQIDVEVHSGKGSNDDKERQRPEVLVSGRPVRQPVFEKVGLTYAVGEKLAHVAGGLVASAEAVVWWIRSTRRHASVTLVDVVLLHSFGPGLSDMMWTTFAVGCGE